MARNRTDARWGHIQPDHVLYNLRKVGADVRVVRVLGERLSVHLIWKCER